MYIIYAKGKQEHDRILWDVMQLMQQNKLRLKITKCTFYAQQFEYLGWHKSQPDKNE